MANAKLSPRELAELRDKLDEAQRGVESIREQLIHAMAARRRPRTRTATRRNRRITRR